MTRELERAKEERIGRAALDTCMMHAVGIDDAADARDTREPANRDATMHEAIVDEEIGETEDRSAEAHPERYLSPDANRAAATVQNERDREGGVENGERVVQLERAVPWQMMRAMDREEHAVPEPAVKETRPQVHEHRHDERGRDPNRPARNVHRLLRDAA